MPGRVSAPKRKTTARTAASKRRAPRAAAKQAAAIVVRPADAPARAGRVVHLVPRSRARIDLFERQRASGSRWGDISASELITVLQKSAKGDVADWADLCEYMIDSEDLFSSLYETYITRIVQADWIIAPCKYGDRDLALRATRLCDDLFARIDNTNQLLRDLLHAAAPGFSGNENHWARDTKNSINFVERVEHVHGHRFRFDERWQPRLYDKGIRMGADGYGEVLTPNGWLFHTHQIQSGYPGIAGIMRSCALKWLFRRWVAKWEVSNLEVHGRPLVYAEVGPNTPDTVREQILLDLENLSADHYGVVEAGTKLIVDATAAASRNFEAFRAFSDGTKEDIVTAWLGHSDAVSPGTHGSQSAVETRAGQTADPRMVARGVSLGNTISTQLFRSFILLNSHKLGVSVEDARYVPLPEFRLKTAADEAKVDVQDLHDEDAAERPTSVPVPEDVDSTPSPPDEKAVPKPSPDAADVPASDAALNGAQVASLLEIVTQAAAGQIPRETAKAIITSAFPISDEHAERILGTIGNGFVPKPEDEPPREPQPASTPANPPPKTKSPLALALRGRL